MAQALPRFCPRCGTPTRANMRLCPVCGLSAEAMLSRSRKSNDSAPQGSTPDPARIVPTPTSRQHGNQEPRSPSPPSQDFQSPRAASGQPELSPRFSSASSPSKNSQDALKDPGDVPDVEEWPTQIEQQPFSPTLPTAQKSQNVFQVPANNPDIEEWPTQIEQVPFPPIPPVAQAAQNASNDPRSMPGTQAPWATQTGPGQPPTYAPTPQPGGRRRLGIVVAVLLVGLLVLGGGGYLAYSLIGGHLLGLKASQSQIKTTSLNLPVNYAGIDITILNVQQAQNFLDDPQAASNGMLRLNLQEQNKTTASVSWNYNTSARLISEGVAPIVPVYVKSKGSITPGTTQKSVIDFPIANGGDLNKLIFQLGTSNQAQLQIPLAGQAGIDKYRPQTRQQNGTTIYFGLNWTLNSATTSLSIPGQQAASGMEFLTLTLKVDSTLSQETITGSPFDYLRVKAGGKTATLVDTTLPVSFATSETGKTGTATFLIPQNSRACTLILLSQDPGGSGQASIAFQVS